MRKIKKYLKYIGNVVTILALIFLVFALSKLGINFESLANPKSIIVCIVGTLGVTITVYILAYAWKNTLDYLSGSRTKYSEVAGVYGKANIGKYLPGNVMHYVERNLFATKIGLDQFELGISSILEVVGFIIVTILVSVICAYREFIKVINKYVTPTYAAILCGVIIAGIAVVILVCFKSKKIQRIIKRLLDVKFAGVFLINMLLYLIVFIILGAVLLLICTVALDVKFTVYEGALLIAYYMLAWVVGFMIPGAPGGIGVREAVLYMLLGVNHNIKNMELIFTAAMIHRMLSIFGDVIGYCISLPLNRKSE